MEYLDIIEYFSRIFSVVTNISDEYLGAQFIQIYVFI